ncbi:Type II secretion system protein F [Stieleria neptunia]|uniref:Type II secretion system protein F n=1 Tax=Stieleria neptunia TaxID=2527979 RepID=A0A518HTP0_9BACT|nr:type II secretion system F family protein [Stieleria neptunia]QDV44225.1 Type II secretion system protein F [Stieleria neptunia]
MSTASSRGGAGAVNGRDQTESWALLKSLHEIKFGNDPQHRFKRKDLIVFLRNLTTLVQNGVSLTHALETVTRDRSLKKYQHILSSISRALKGGESLSASMKTFPSAFNMTLVSQVEVGERSGKLDQALLRITEQLERSSGHRKMILKKLAYPAILVVAGTGSVIFMLLCVIPTFQEMYEDAGATLPAITQLLIDVSAIVQVYGFHLLGLSIVLAITVITLFKNVQSRRWIDRNLIRIPIVGEWFRNLAILQFADVLGNLMESGFTLAEALPPAGRAIGNRHVQEKILGLYTAIRRGERFSQSLQREGDLFPAVVNQLVIVGERTGRLVPVTHQIRKHLRRDVEDSTDAIVGAIEPILTIVLAVAVGGILLAVYLPMFDLIGKVNQ